jgi:hypothetical protein
MAARQGLVWLTVLLLALAIAASLAADTPDNKADKKNGPAKVLFLRATFFFVSPLSRKMKKNRNGNSSLLSCRR